MLLLPLLLLLLPPLPLLLPQTATAATATATAATATAATTATDCHCCYCHFCYCHCCCLLLLLPLLLQSNWRGPAYRLLEHNCNHFARELLERMLASPQFRPAPGKETVEAILPNTVTQLTDCGQFWCSIFCPCLHRRMNRCVVLGV